MSREKNEIYKYCYSHVSYGSLKKEISRYYQGLLKQKKGGDNPLQGERRTPAHCAKIPPLEF